MKNLPRISDAAFWDVKLKRDSREEFEEYSTYIIQKIFDFGTLDDIIEVVKYYGKQRIKREIIQVNVREKTISLCCVLFNLKNTDFKCYKKRQLSPKLWNY